MTSISSVLGSARAASSALGSLASTLSGQSFADSLRTASFSGIPFAVEEVTTIRGRRVSVHSYPYRDDAWIEDLGSLSRVFRINGFLIENSLIYGGGGLIDQAQRLLNVCDTPVGKTFVHPTLGTIKNVYCIAPIELVERKDLGRVYEFTLTLMKGGARVYPKATSDSTSLSSLSAIASFAAAVLNFVSKVASVISLGVSIVNAAIATVEKWYAIAKSVISDVRAIVNAVSSLSGSYGRYASGGNSGYAKKNQAAALTATAATLLAANVTARAAVETAGASLASAASAVSDTAAFSTAVSALASAVRATSTNPADAIRMLSTLSAFSPSDTFPASVIGDGMTTMQSACGALMRRAAISELVQASTIYQPSSLDDALTVRNSIVAVIDDELTTAGDEGDDGTYKALRTLRNAVISDFASRGGDLPSVKTFTFGTGLPALTLANRIYKDASRGDELVTQANPIHPAFMPTSFGALSK